MHSDIPVEIAVQIDNISCWADFDEGRQAYWEDLIRCTRIPSLFIGKTRGLENLESCDSQDIRDRIRRDPLLASKLLSVANSTKTGQRNPVKSIDKAFNQLGLDLVLAIVLVYEMENDLHEGARISPRVLQQVRAMASLAHAIAMIYARELKLGDPEAFVNAALLSVVATLLLAQSPKFDEEEYLGFPDEFMRLQHEQAVWGVCSPIIAQRMVELWGLHEPVPTLVGSRHLPILGMLDPALPKYQAKQICLIAVINALCQAYMQRNKITPEILLDRRNYKLLKNNLLDLGLYVSVGRYWGMRSTENILRASY
jgi:HD-like signal output (HDOD) protein